MSLTAEIAHLSMAIKNLSQVESGMPLIHTINRSQIIQLQNELDVKLEILRISFEAPEQKC